MIFINDQKILIILRCIHDTIYYLYIYRLVPDRSLSCGMGDRERLSLQSLETITDALLEIMEACMRDIPDCDWLQAWTGLAKNFAFQYNPALQPRALIVFGCISKYKFACFFNYRVNVMKTRMNCMKVRYPLEVSFSLVVFYGRAINVWIWITSC